MRRIHDISITLAPGMPTWPGDPPFQRELFRAMARGDSVNASGLRMSAHAGTHIDAPVHFIADGKGAEAIPLEDLIGPCHVAYFPDAKEIGLEDLKTLRLGPSTKRLLLRTKNSELWSGTNGGFSKDFVALTPDAAEWVAQQGLRLVGIDYLSVQRFADPTPTTHLALLSRGVLVLEGLNLAGVRPGTYELICLPLKLLGSDGAPARAVLLEN